MGSRYWEDCEVVSVPVAEQRTHEHYPQNSVGEHLERCAPNAGHRIKPIQREQGKAVSDGEASGQDQCEARHGGSVREETRPR